VPRVILTFGVWKKGVRGSGSGSGSDHSLSARSSWLQLWLWLWLRVLVLVLVLVLTVGNGPRWFWFGLAKGREVTWPAWQIFNANNALKSKASHVCGITARGADRQKGTSSPPMSSRQIYLTSHVAGPFFMSCCWCCSLVLMLEVRGCGGACKSAFYSTGLPTDSPLRSRSLSPSQNANLGA